MAWNEPGNQNDRDPWGGNRGGNQGPPELDEVAKKVQEKLGKIFGGGKGSGSGSRSSGGSSGLSAGLVGVVIVGLLLVWAALGFYTVDQKERGVVLRLGKFTDVVQPGLHWNPPLIDEVAKINVTEVQSHSSRGTMLTEDENIVDISLSVQYLIANPKDFYLNVRDPELSLTHATDSALRHVVGSSSMDSVLTEGRELLSTDVLARLQDYLDKYGAGLQISKVNIEDAQAPQEVQAAFDDVIKAKEDEQRVKNEAQTYANGIIPVARGYAQRLLEEANAYKEQVISRAEGEADRFQKLLAEYTKAPKVTRERLYIEAIESVYAQSSKVMVDVEGGNNLLYLPLDKLAQPGSATSGGSVVTDRDLENLTNQVIQRINERRSSSRLREGR